MKLTHKQFLLKRSKRKPLYVKNVVMIGNTKYDLMSDDSLRRNPRVVRGKAIRKAYKKAKQASRE